MGKETSIEKLTRIAVVNEDKCKPNKCAKECMKACPVNKIGKVCIEVKRISIISEQLCIGCSLCAKKCPFNAISIFNLPTNIDKDCSHRYGENSFKLHRLPVPKPGRVLGLVGTNGIGKSTALKILSGKIRPNFGKFDKLIEWQDVAKYYKGSELHGYFTKFLEGGLITANKIQYIDKIPRILSKMFNKESLTVKEIIDIMDEREMKDYYIKRFDLVNILERDLNDLSGGELQRFSIAVNCMKNANVYVFDEPTSFLDVKQRLTAAKEIRKLCDNNDKYVIVVEHDLAILDLMSDYGCVLYGESGVYGVISSPYTIKNAINIFLDGFIPTENMRFRESALKFSIQQLEDSIKVDRKMNYYLENTKTFKSKKGKTEFKLTLSGGHFSNSEITVLLGENGMGKSTFVNLLGGLIKTDSGELLFEGMSVSLKSQKIVPKFKGTVKEILDVKLKGKLLNSAFRNEVIKPLNIEYLYDNELASLSGGELQRVAIVLCLGKDADIYLLDEPAAFLDSDQRIAVSKMIKKYIYANNKTAFIVEHDLVVATYLADRIIVFDGQPGVLSRASEPLDIKEGMNRFLKTLDITFRRDSTNYRPRVNKPDSNKDREQKESGNYFFV
ncbi:ABCE1 [Hepatospora eriocheir]|uniref:ABCE1 n=1 Tax=Hepatospora eriocheir TaxID=1081669 RepID=A0A1X0QK03_9MICR|nr:ABCE1 [Hepatospora eriocheir]